MVELARSRREREVGARDALNPKAGYALGRLYLRNMISEEQHEAGIQWAQIVARYCAVSGIKPPMPATGGFEMVARGLPCGDPPSDEAIHRAISAYQDAFVALKESDWSGGQAKVCRDICILDYHEGNLDAESLGTLRCGLNALARFLGLTRGNKPCTRRYLD